MWREGGRVLKKERKKVKKCVDFGREDSEGKECKREESVGDRRAQQRSI